jgi:hypothetical protein
MALQNGQLKLPDPGTIAADGNGIYPTSGIPRQDADGRIVYPPATEEEALQNMSTPQMAAYLKQKYELPRPPNMWEQFPTAGERKARYER